MVVHVDHSGEPIKISKSIIINKDLTWSVFVHGQLADKSPAISSIPKVLSPNTFSELHLEVKFVLALQKRSMLTCAAKRKASYLL